MESLLASHESGYSGTAHKFAVESDQQSFHCCLNCDEKKTCCALCLQLTFSSTAPATLCGAAAEGDLAEQLASQQADMSADYEQMMIALDALWVGEVDGEEAEA